jgi:hypothetical protein
MKSDFEIAGIAVAVLRMQIEHETPAVGDPGLSEEANVTVCQWSLPKGID